VPLPPRDTRALFRPLTSDIVSLLRTLSPDDWTQPTLAGTWRVREVVAHMVDTALRRLSAARDQATFPAPEKPIRNERDLAAFINDLNASWIRGTRPLSPRVLTDLYAHAAGQLSDYMEKASLEGFARFPVSWAGEAESPTWFDIGREFTEVFHHGAQIRAAVHAGPFLDPQWLHIVLDLVVRGLPHAYRHTRAPAGTAIQLHITGPSGGDWTLQTIDDRWDISAGNTNQPTATATMSDETAWRLLFNALAPAEADSLIRLDGDAALGRLLWSARSVIV
jgi:uncharacterized protein (TIGR03083 family)